MPGAGSSTATGLTIATYTRLPFTWTKLTELGTSRSLAVFRPARVQATLVAGSVSWMTPRNVFQVLEPESKAALWAPSVEPERRFTCTPAAEPDTVRATRTTGIAPRMVGAPVDP